MKTNLLMSAIVIACGFAMLSIQGCTTAQVQAGTTPAALCADETLGLSIASKTKLQSLIAHNANSVAAVQALCASLGTQAAPAVVTQ